MVKILFKHAATFFCWSIPEDPISGSKSIDIFPGQSRELAFPDGSPYARFSEITLLEREEKFTDARGVTQKEAVLFTEIKLNKDWKAPAYPGFSCIFENHLAWDQSMKGYCSGGFHIAVPFGIPLLITNLSASSDEAKYKRFSMTRKTLLTREDEHGIVRPQMLGGSFVREKRPLAELRKIAELSMRIKKEGLTDDIKEAEQMQVEQELGDTFLKGLI